MIRNRLGALRQRIAQQSTIGRLVALVGGVVLFLIAQQFAGISNGAARGTPTMMLAGLVSFVLAFLALYIVYAVIRAFLGGSPSAESADTA